MTSPSTVRVAAAQLFVGADIEANLQSCLRMLDEASTCQPDLIVLPEFCNHLSWYADKQHCFDVSVTLDGPFLSTIAARAAELGVHVVVNCTVQREDGAATGSSLLYSPAGKLLADNTKQIYIGHENDYLERAQTEGPVVQSAVGRIGLYACMDGVINETPRCLALNGAQLMLNSLNSFATDEASLHIPVRAAENKVYVVAANKVGSLVPEEMMGGISETTGIPERFLCGAGESQIVAPDGAVLAKASPDREEFVYADIVVSAADDKRRPDGTDLFARRRPELYAQIAEDPQNQPVTMVDAPAEVCAATVHLAGRADLDEVVERIGAARDAGARLICLPPLLAETGDLEEAADFGARVVARVGAAAGDAWVATSIICRDGDGGHRHCAVLIDGDGVALEQGQIHASHRFAFSSPVDAVATVDLPIGRVAVVTSDDSIYPETFRLLAMAGVQIAAVPLRPLEQWELDTGLLERSAENRINLLVAVDGGEFGGGFSTALQTDFTVMTQWHERPFDGLLSQPEWRRYPAQAGVYIDQVRPANAANKVVSQNTDLLAGRPWQLCNAITRIDNNQ